MNKIKLFTHTDLDGIGGAVLAYLAFGRENVDVEYCDYNNVDEKVEIFIEQEELFKSYDKIYITDISVSEEVANIIDILDCPPKRVRLFDHHATALWLNQYAWCQVQVNAPEDSYCKSSGTELFAMHLFNNEQFDQYDSNTIANIYRFVEIVRDYDTWRWKELGNEGIVCKQVNDLFYIYGRDEFIDWAMDQLTKSEPERDPYIAFPRFTDMDNVLLEQKQKDIDCYIEKKDQQLHGPFKDHIGYTYAVVFAEKYFSELGNRLCELHPWLDYVAMIDISNGAVSYRAIKEDIDLGGEIAHSFGGGGHRKAAGSQFDAEYILSRIMNEIFFYKADEERDRIIEAFCDAGETYPIFAEDLKKAYIRQF